MALGNPHNEFYSKYIMLNGRNNFKNFADQPVCPLPPRKFLKNARRTHCLCFVLHAPDQEIVGGVIGETYWDWFYLDLLWVIDELRGRGYGYNLLTLAEGEARQRSARNVYLDKFSFQAPNFF
jgi:GNAT superfamily N-acetyltransferase